MVCLLRVACAGVHCGEIAAGTYGAAATAVAGHAQAKCLQFFREAVVSLDFFKGLAAAIPLRKLWERVVSLDFYKAVAAGPLL